METKDKIANIVSKMAEIVNEVEALTVTEVVNIPFSTRKHVWLTVKKFDDKLEHFRKLLEMNKDHVKSNPFDGFPTEQGSFDGYEIW